MGAMTVTTQYIKALYGREKKRAAPDVGIEPTTTRLKVGRSTD
jgi:hypothetical protein